MALILGDHRVERAAVIDDDGLARETFGYNIEDLELEPVPLEPGADSSQFDIETCMSFVRQHSQAVFCDHHLRKQRYASFDGAELVSLCYKTKFPAVLCTRWEQADLLDVRSYRQFIPSLLKPDEVNPDSIRRGWELCVREFHGDFEPDRRPHRALVRIVEIDESRETCFLILPGWNPDEGLRVKLKDLGEPASEYLLTRSQEIEMAPLRLHVRTNLGAETAEELYFFGWEID